MESFDEICNKEKPEDNHCEQHPDARLVSIKNGLGVIIDWVCSKCVQEEYDPPEVEDGNRLPGSIG
ncbi:MAG: hypothetical protein ABEJ02_01070 [Candidatus Paceibacteria bacterium]